VCYSAGSSGPSVRCTLLALHGSHAHGYGFGVGTSVETLTHTQRPGGFRYPVSNTNYIECLYYFLYLILSSSTPLDTFFTGNEGQEHAAKI
jgi:hypothetical protein